ncbi:hypothetical protein M9Y10_042398 [Tritrichomonas musculus]|uniref:Uncharacterized protein n=1 Tax=Tritrichomonas musculus TaxID=1915356 RepID=A0ABR2GJH0_9EUKA
MGAFRSDAQDYQAEVDEAYSLADEAAKRNPEREDEAYKIADRYARQLADWQEEQAEPGVGQPLQGDAENRIAQRPHPQDWNICGDHQERRRQRHREATRQAGITDQEAGGHEGRECQGTQGRKASTVRLLHPLQQQPEHPLREEAHRAA